jgi:hypothetical protein
MSSTRSFQSLVEGFAITSSHRIKARKDTTDPNIVNLFFFMPTTTSNDKTTNQSINQSIDPIHFRAARPLFHKTSLQQQRKSY